MSSPEAFIHALVREFPELHPLLSQHLEDEEGDLLTYVFMGDVAAWAHGESGTRPAEAAALIRWLEERFSEEDDDVTNLIAVGFVEMLPPTPQGDRVLALLGPQLHRQADEFGLFLPSEPVGE